MISKIDKTPRHRHRARMNCKLGVRVEMHCIYVLKSRQIVVESSLNKVIQEAFASVHRNVPREKSEEVIKGRSRHDVWK